MNFARTILLEVTLFVMLPVCAATAECPSSKLPTQGYILGLGGSKSEIYRLNSGETRVVTRYKTGDVVEQTLYQGLIRIEHLDRGKRLKFEPKTDLNHIFPLKMGQLHPVEFDTEANGQKRVLRSEFKVVGQDKIIVGPCQFDVLKVEHRNRFGDGPLLFINTDWYAPDIKMILAREYNESNARTSIRKYDSIFVIEEEKAPARK